MDASRTEQQLVQSCQILFGEDLHISRDFLAYLQPTGLKSAYRRRAKETHPDCVGNVHPLAAPADSDLFIRVNGAYQRLQQFLQERGKNRPILSKPWPGPTASPATEPPPTSPLRPTSGTGTDGFYSGPMPNRQLLFGHFLYYSGLTNWRTISRILSWQKRDRPRLGELGQRYGMLTTAEITTILSHPAPRRPFGETALQLGILNEFQLRALLNRQQQLQKKFGTLLLEHNLIDQDDLHYLLHQFATHNQKSWRAC